MHQVFVSGLRNVGSSSMTDGELTVIRRRLGEILQLCGGDQRGPAVAIPDHPRASELQTEWEALRQRFSELAPKHRRVKPRHNPRRPRRIRIPHEFRLLKAGIQPAADNFPVELFEDVRSW